MPKETTRPTANFQCSSRNSLWSPTVALTIRTKTAVPSAMLIQWATMRHKEASAVARTTSKAVIMSAATATRPTCPIRRSTRIKSKSTAKAPTARFARHLPLAVAGAARAKILTNAWTRKVRIISWPRRDVVDLRIPSYGSKSCTECS